MSWNKPYGPISSLAPRVVVRVSPNPAFVISYDNVEVVDLIARVILSDIGVTTPSSAGGAPFLTAVAVKAMKPIIRARLFVEGRHNELLRSRTSNRGCHYASKSVDGALKHVTKHHVDVDASILALLLVKGKTLGPRASRPDR